MTCGFDVSTVPGHVKNSHDPTLYHDEPSHQKDSSILLVDSNVSANSAKILPETRFKYATIAKTF